jgi:hypothetical protein
MVLLVSSIASWLAARLQAATTTGTRPATAAVPPTTPTSFTLSLPGYGILFFHQLGQLCHLRDRGLFSSSSSSARTALDAVLGSSAGALAAALVASGVSAERAATAAHALCERAGLYDPRGGLLARLILRPCALAGRWGGLVRRWLRELLPDDAHERAVCAKVAVAVVRVGGGGGLSTLHLTDFGSRDELIEALAASAHVPFFMDGKPFARTRWGWLLDGSFLHLLLGARRGGLTRTTAAAAAAAAKVVPLDPFDDPELRRAGWGWRHCLALPSLEGALALVAMGRRHAAEMERRGVFDGGLLFPAAVKEKEEDKALAGAGGSSASLASSSSSWRVGTEVVVAGASASASADEEEEDEDKDEVGGGGGPR